jgi:hypothetical protein
VSDQLDLFHQPDDPPAPNPNADFFNEDGSPKRLLWCSDTVRIAFNRGEDAPCPYLEPRPSRAEPGTMLPPIGADKMPAGGCCKDLAARHESPQHTQLTELPGTTWEDMFAGPPSRTRSAA